jgi:hypothetical protein
MIAGLEDLDEAFRHPKEQAVLERDPAGPPPGKIALTCISGEFSYP